MMPDHQLEFREIMGQVYLVECWVNTSEAARAIGTYPGGMFNFIVKHGLETRRSPKNGNWRMVNLTEIRRILCQD